MKWIKMISLCSDDSIRAIKAIVSKDLQLILNELHEEQKSQIVKVIPETPRIDKAKPKKARRIYSKQGEPITVFGRTFPNIVKMAKYFKLPPGTCYGWHQRGDDLEQLIKARGVFPNEDKPKTIIKGQDDNGNKMYKL